MALALVNKAAVIHDMIQYQHEQFSAIGHEEAFKAIDHIINGIMDMETVNATPVKHGHWMKDSARMLYQCSLCHSSFQEIGYGFNFCPECGAKMDEVEK